MKTHKEIAIEIFNQMNMAILEGYLGEREYSLVLEEYIRDQGFYKEAKACNLVSIQNIIDNINYFSFGLTRYNGETDIDYWNKVYEEALNL